MEDKKWLELMFKMKSILKEKDDVLNKLENEYRRRYGNYPSEVDDDCWIDTFHYNAGAIDFAEIKSSALRRKNCKNN